MRIKILAAILALVAAVVAAQTLTQKIDVTVVNVDVVVTGPDGRPIHGLTKDDFQLFEDGKPQPITNFYAVENRPVPAAGTATVDAAATTQSSPRFRRKVLLLIDNAHISKRGRDIALDRLEKFIDEGFHTGEYEWSIAAVGGRLGMVLPLTSDKQRIHDVLAVMRQGSARPAEVERLTALDGGSIDMQAMQYTGFDAAETGNTFARNQNDVERAMRAKFSVEAIVGAARAFAATEGKKIILLLSDSSDLNDIDQSFVTHYAMVQRSIISPSQTDDLAATAKDLKSLRDRLVSEANASNVSFYIINPEGLRAPGDLGLSRESQSDATGTTNNQAMFWLAQETGGRLMSSNDIDLSIKQFDTTSSNFYSLGFRPAHDDGKYHRLTLKLTKRGKYEVHYRDGYANVSADAQIERMLKSPIAAPLRDLPVTLVTEPAQPQKRDSVLVPFQAKVPISKLQFLPSGEKWNAKVDIYVSVFDESGKNVTLQRFAAAATAASANPDPNGIFVYRNGVMLRKGQRHRIVVAMRDDITDAMGTAEKVVLPE